MGSVPGSGQSGPSGKRTTNGAAGINGQNLLTVEEDQTNIQPSAMTFTSLMQAIVYLLFTWSNFFKLLFLVFFAMTILTFPWGEDIK